MTIQENVLNFILKMLKAPIRALQRHLKKKHKETIDLRLLSVCRSVCLSLYLSVLSEITPNIKSCVWRHANSSHRLPDQKSPVHPEVGFLRWHGKTDGRTTYKNKAKAISAKLLDEQETVIESHCIHHQKFPSNFHQNCHQNSYHPNQNPIKILLNFPSKFP